MKRLVHLVTAGLALSASAAEWKSAAPGWQYDFPRDHHIHREFKTEWWYFTGNLTDERGARFGYELTFFRHGIRPESQRDPAASRFLVGELKFAHFAITDVSNQRFRFAQKTSRGAYGEAGFDDGPRLAWIEEWSLTANEDDSFNLVAVAKEATIRLTLRATKSPVVHGEAGISRKAPGESHASHYYSMTRLQTTGELLLNGARHTVAGESWFDHEWATNQLAPEQIGWDWLSLHLDDGSELMLYQMRLADGTADPSSSGTLIAADGTSLHLPSISYRMIPLETWRSSKTGASYPIAWEIELPEHHLRLTVRAAVKDQELVFTPLIYWEGTVDVTGLHAGKPISGRGYLELTGYAGPLRELQR